MPVASENATQHTIDQSTYLDKDYQCNILYLHAFHIGK